MAEVEETFSPLFDSPPDSTPDHPLQQRQPTLQERVFKVLAVAMSVVLFLAPMGLPEALVPGLQPALLYGLSGANCITWMVFGRVSPNPDIVIEQVNLFGCVIELLYTVWTFPLLRQTSGLCPPPQSRIALVVPLFGAIFYYAGLRTVVWYTANEPVCCETCTVLQACGIATTVFSSGGPLVLRLVSVVLDWRRSRGVPYMPLLVLACNGLWARFSSLAGNRLMLKANIAAAVFTGLLFAAMLF